MIRSNGQYLSLLQQKLFSFDGSHYIYTLSRLIIRVSQMHMVLTSLSWSFLVDKERLSSNNASKCVARWKEKQQRFNILDNSTWHRTECIISARELMLCISSSSFSRALCTYQINLVKNYNVLKQAAKN